MKVGVKVIFGQYLYQVQVNQDLNIGEEFLPWRNAQSILQTRSRKQRVLCSLNNNIDTAPVLTEDIDSMLDYSTREESDSDHVRNGSRKISRSSTPCSSAVGLR